MKNFKKLFSIVAIAAILGMAVPTTVLGAASYSDELQGAYDYAYGNGITTQSSIDTANMYGSLTRVAMAKMMANYAIEVLGQTPDTTKECSFPDVSTALDDQYDNGVTNACQLGLMGVGITNFNPNGLVTRAEFGTVLSRALYGDVNNGGTPYYVNHLQALKDAGIMNNINTPSQLEVRGYVMLMMQRADEGTGTPEICTTPENVLSCSLGLDTCPVECQAAQEAKSGTLNVSAVGADYTSIPNTGAVKFATVTFKAGSEDVKVYGVTFKKDALSAVTAAKLYFEKDGARVTSKASFSENKATVSFSTALEVKAGSSETVDLYMLLNGSTVGNEYQFSSTYVDSSAATVDGTITTPLMRTLAYDIAAVNMANAGLNVSYKVDANKLVELGQFSLYKTGTARTDKDVTFKAISLTQKESASLDYLSDLAIYRDDVKVSTKTTVDGRNVSFVLNDEIKSTSSSTIYYVVKAKITGAERVGDKYTFSVKYPENTLVEEKSTNFKATVTPTAAFDLAVNTINGGDLRFNQPATSYTKDVVPGTLGVVFYTGTITSLESMTLENPKLNFVSTVSGGVDTLRTIYFKIGNTVMSATPPTGLTGLVEFEGTVVVNGTVNVSVYADVKDTATAGSVKFTDSLNGLRFLGTNEYSDGTTFTGAGIGSLSPITNNIVAAGLQMTNTYSNAQNVQKGDRDIKLADLKFSTTTDVMSKISSFKVNLVGTGLTNFQGGTVTVYDAAGTALVSDSITTANYLTFVLPNTVNVSKTTPAIFTLKLDQVANSVVAASGDALALSFYTTGVVAKNFITNSSIYPTSATTSSLLTVVAAGTVTTVSQSFNPKLVQLNGTTVALGSVKFTPYNGNAYLKNMYLSLSGSNTDMFTELTLQDSGTTVATFLDNGSTPYFTNLSTSALAAGTTKTYDIVATLKTATTAANLSTGFVINVTSAGFESANGVAITGTIANPVASSVTEFVKAKPTVSYVSSQKGGNAVYKFMIKANGGDVKLSSIDLDILNNTSAATATGTLYLGNEGGTSLGTVSISSGANLAKSFANLSGLVNITNGTSQEFTLVFPVSTWYAWTVVGNIGIEVSNLSYYDTFTDWTTLLHSSMFTSYKWDIAPVTTLVTLQ